VDFKKSYDSVHRHSLINILKEFEFPNKLIKLIEATLQNTEIKIKIVRVTVARRVEELGTDIEITLKERISKFIFYSLAVDESTDVSDTVQLAIFIRGIDSNFNITEELAALFSMKGTTKSCDIVNALNLTLNRFDIKLNKLFRVITNGAPSMVGKNEGLVALIKKEMSTCGAFTTDAISLHYLPRKFMCKIRWFSNYYERCCKNSKFYQIKSIES
jgi:hypothetical protein